MADWAVIPKWLYQNDLPDDELQALYVQQAEKKYRECVEARKALEQDLVLARCQEAAARDFLMEAREALKKYQRPQTTVEPVEEAPYTETRTRLPGQRRALPRPDGGERR